MQSLRKFLNITATTGASALVAFALSTSAFAESVSGKLGLGGNFGLNTPVGSDAVKTQAKSGIVFGGYIQHYISPFFGFELAYDRLSFGDVNKNMPNNLDAHLFTLSGQVTILPHLRYSPIVGFGVGPAIVKDLVDAPSSITNLAIKPMVGFQYQVVPFMTIGARGTYVFITTMSSSTHEIHVIQPQLAVTFHL